MRNTYQVITERIWRGFAEINAAIDAEIYTCAGEGVFCLFRFEIDADTVGRICEILVEDADLRRALERAIQAHRSSSHWTTLVEHVLAVDQLQAKLACLEHGLSHFPADGRKQLVEQINCIDGEIGLCRRLADRRNIAARINERAGFPVIDGLTLRGLTFLLGEDEDLWRDLRPLLDGTAAMASGRQPLADG
jgi:hypothetical protein